MKTLEEVLSTENSTKNVTDFVLSMTSTELEGSEKQISWALKIRSEYVNNIIPELQEKISRIQQLSNEKDAEYLQKYFTKKISPILEKLQFFQDTTSAGEIINNRFE